MSWDTFKKIMKPYMDNPDGVKSKEAFAKQFTVAYDTAIKMGSVTTRGVLGSPLPVATGNTDVMEKLMIAACAIAFTKSETGKHTWLKDIGAAVIGYWGGAQLAQVPPLIPALFSFQNIALISGVVSNPGKWPTTRPEQPVDSSEIFLDLFISYAQTHLTTIQFSCTTISLYFGFPLIPPLPGYIGLTGYTLTPAPPAAPAPPQVITPEVKAKVEEATKMAPEQEAVANEATELGYAVNESTSIGLSVPITPPGGTPAPKPVIPEKERPVSETQESYPSNLSEKIEGCDGVKLYNPPQSVINAMKKYGILTPIQRAHFLAQCAHESGGFKWTEEFASGAAYEGRKDLGNIHPGDGKRYKGRGFIQLTGRINYTQFRKGVDDDVVQNPFIVKTTYAAETAGWYWKTRKINNLAIDDTQDSVLKVSIKINGKNKNGLPNGWDDRKRYFCGYWKKLQEDPTLYT
jgi:putative chitinase